MSAERKTALKIARKYSVKSFTEGEIIRVLEECGFVVLDESEDQKRFEAVMCALEMGERFVTRCFSSVSDKAKFVFIPLSVNEEEKIYFLSEQLACFLYGYYDKGTNLELDIRQKQRIKGFSVHFEEICNAHGIKGVFVKYKPEAVTTCLLLAVIILAFSFTALYEALSKNENENMLVYSKKAEKTMENPTLVGDKKEASVNYVSENTNVIHDENVVYYATASGKKYHVEGCTYIKDLDKCTAYTAEELSDTSLEPCRRCLGDEV